MIGQAEGSSDAFSGTACDQQAEKSSTLGGSPFTSFSIFLCVPAKATESDGNSAQAQEGQDLYQKLKTGKRPQSEKTYETPEQPTVYLTFDDGPSKLTSQVLDILDKENVKATFFALGEQAQAHPELVKRIVQDGHTLGNHSYNHIYKELYSDFQTFWDQIQRSEDVFARYWLIPDRNWCAPLEVHIRISMRTTTI